MKHKYLLNRLNYDIDYLEDAYCRSRKKPSECSIDYEWGNLDLTLADLYEIKNILLQRKEDVAQDKPLPCKVCGTMPVLILVGGIPNADGYVCPKALKNECASLEDEMKKAARDKWNERNK